MHKTIVFDPKNKPKPYKYTAKALETQEPVCGYLYIESDIFTGEENYYLQVTADNRKTNLQYQSIPVDKDTVRPLDQQAEIQLLLDQGYHVSLIENQESPNTGDKPAVLHTYQPGDTVTGCYWDLKEHYVTVVRHAACRDTQICVGSDYDPLNDNTWMDAWEAEVFAGVYHANSPAAARQMAAQFMCTIPDNIRVIRIS